MNDALSGVTISDLGLPGFTAKALGSYPDAAALDAASDEELLAIRGVAERALALIRQACRDKRLQLIQEAAAGSVSPPPRPPKPAGEPSAPSEASPTGATPAAGFRAAPQPPPVILPGDPCFYTAADGRHLPAVVGKIYDEGPYVDLWAQANPHGSPQLNARQVPYDPDPGALQSWRVTA